MIKYISKYFSVLFIFLSLQYTLFFFLGEGTVHTKKKKNLKGSKLPFKKINFYKDFV